MPTEFFDSRNHPPALCSQRLRAFRRLSVFRISTNPHAMQTSCFRWLEHLPPTHENSTFPPLLERDNPSYLILRKLHGTRRPCFALQPMLPISGHRGHSDGEP